MIAFVILVFVESQDLMTPLPRTLSQVAEEVLGPTSTVAVASAAGALTPPAQLMAGRARSAFAVARVVWSGADRLAARLEVTIVADGRTMAQAVSFDRSDPLAERGRAIGLVLASLLRHELVARSDQPPREVRAPTGPTEEAVARAAPPPASRGPGPPERRWALDAAAEGGFALGGAGTGAGGTAGVRWMRFRRLALRASARARFGEVGAASAASLAFAAGAGAVLSIVEPATASGRLSLAGRAEALLLYESLSHLSGDDTSSVRRGRLLPGASLLAEARWSLSPAVAVMVAAGPEVAFGTTHVITRQAEVAELAPVRLVVQAGLMASF